MYGNKNGPRRQFSGWKSDCGGLEPDNASQYSTESSDKFGNDKLRAPDIGQRVHLLFKNQLYTDVKFVLSCGIKPKPFILAHKAILAIGSPKFAEMFENKTADGDALHIQINNIPFKAFSSLVEYLYTDDVYFGNDSLVIDIMVAAKAFEVTALAARCENYIESAEITEANVCTKLHLATSHKMESLKTRCTQFIQENTGAVIRSPDFKNSNASTVRNVCKLQKLNLSSEKELFEGVMEWIEAQPDGQKHKRRLLDPLLPHIRFLTITSAAFTQLVSKYPKVFTDAEALNIVLHLNNTKSNSNRLPTWCNLGANRCLTVRGAQISTYSGVQNALDKKLSICLRPTPSGYAPDLLCMLAMKCIEGQHRIKALKLAFDEPVDKYSSIDRMIITIRTEPSQYTFKECIKIHNSTEVVVPFSRSLLARKGDTVYIHAEASEIRNYKFLQFDEKNSILSQFSFECNVGSKPKNNRLFFIAEVCFEGVSHRPGKPSLYRGKR